MIFPEAVVTLFCMVVYVFSMLMNDSRAESRHASHTKLLWSNMNATARSYEIWMVNSQKSHRFLVNKL